MSEFTKKLLKGIAAVALVLSAAIPAFALPTDYYAANSAMASGTWVKISVDECGMYQISYEQLRALGFNDPSKVTVWGYGANRLTENTFSTDLPDDIMPTNTLHTDDERIIFYAEAQVAIRLKDSKNLYIRRNMYDNNGVYFLTDVAGAVEIPSAPYIPTNSTPASFQYCVNLIEDDVQNPGEGGAIFHDYTMGLGESREYAFNIRDFDNSGGSTYRGYFRYTYAARSSERMSLEMELPTNVTINSSSNVAVNPVYKNNKLFNTSYGYAQFTKDGNNNLVDATLRFNVRRPTNTTDATYVALDYGYVIYPRTARLRKLSQLMMYVLRATAGNPFQVGDAEPGTCVWNIDDPQNIYAYDTYYNADTQSVVCTYDKTYASGGNTGRIIAFNPSATFPEPQVVGYVPNQNIHGDETPEMVIITTTTLLPFAEELADVHRSIQGMKVNVYTQEQVFNEFSSGCRAAMAYRRLAKMFYDRDPQTFKHLLLYGASTWDNRNSFKNGRDLLIAYEAEAERWASDSGTNFATDSYYGMLGDDYNPDQIYSTLMDINVGRIPALDGSKAVSINKKIREYMQNPPSLRSICSAVALSDKGNRLSHILQSQEVFNTMTSANPALTVVMAPNTIYLTENYSAVQLRSVVTDALTRGTGYFTYSGHGNREYFTMERLWSKHDTEVTPYNDYPVVMLATCDAYAYDRMDDGIAEAMLFSANGGGIAVVGACRSVYLEYNQNINRPMAEAYANADRNSTVGDLFRYAYNHSKANTTDESAMANSLCFNLAGDPAIPVYGISNKAYFSRIGDVEITAETADDAIGITPLVRTLVEGYVADDNGNVDTDFNGTAEIVLYEAPMGVMTKNTVDDAGNIEVTFDETPLATAVATVEAGRFSTYMISPLPARPAQNNRMVVYAMDDSNTLLRASGYTFAVTVDGESDGLEPDLTAPAILDMAVDVPDNATGMIAADCVTFTATIDPSPTGLNTSRGLIGSGVSLQLDGSTSIARVVSAVTTSTDGLCYISLPIEGLAPGNHNLTLRVQNNVGVTDSQTLAFTLSNTTPMVELTVDEKVARSRATLDVDGTIGTGTRLLIRDAQGHTVLSVANPALPYVWNLKDGTGADVADGRYDAHIVAAEGASSTKAQIVVIR